MLTFPWRLTWGASGSATRRLIILLIVVSLDGEPAKGGSNPLDGAHLTSSDVLPHDMSSRTLKAKSLSMLLESRYRGSIAFTSQYVALSHHFLGRISELQISPERSDPIIIVSWFHFYLESGLRNFSVPSQTGSLQPKAG